MRAGSTIYKNFSRGVDGWDKCFRVIVEKWQAWRKILEIYVAGYIGRYIERDKLNFRVRIGKKSVRDVLLLRSKLRQKNGGRSVWQVLRTNRQKDGSHRPQYKSDMEDRHGDLSVEY